MRAIRGLAGVGLLMLALAMGSVSDARLVSGFEEFIGVPGTSHSRDGFRMVVVFEASWYRLKLPGHVRVVVGPKQGDVGRENPYVGLMVGCRVESTWVDHLRGELPFSVLVVGLHPEEEDVPLVFDLKFWWLVLIGREFEERPVEVRIVGLRPMASMFVRQRIEYSIPRPAQVIDLDALSVMRMIGERGAVVAQVRGEDVTVEVVFDPPGARQSAAVQALERLCPWEGRERG